jgi:hypothetical protein
MPIVGTSDVAEAVKSDTSVIRNGSAVVGVRPHGSYSVNNDRDAGGPTATQIETKLESSFDDPRYYSSRSSLMTGLLSWYRFSEPSGVRKNSTNDTTFSLADNNTVARTHDGKIDDGAFFVDANNEYLDIASSSALTTSPAFTIASWIKFTSVSVAQVVFSVWDYGHRRYQISLSSGVLYFNTSSNGSNSSSVNGGSLAADTWYHMVVSYDGANRAVYINSVDVTAGVAAASIWGSSTSSFKIGGAGQFGGTLSETAFWSRGLTETERSRLYNKGAGISYPGL